MHKFRTLPIFDQLERLCVVFCMRQRYIGVLYVSAGVFVAWLDWPALIRAGNLSACVSQVLGGVFAAYGVWRLVGRGWSEIGRSQRLESVVLLVVVLLYVRTGVVGNFEISSGSMIPNLLRGDYVLVNRLAYRCLWRINACESQPRRGDVIVFGDTEGGEIYYVKRVLGLPEEHITYYDDRLMVDGQSFQYQPGAERSFVTETGESVISPGFVESFGAYRSRILEQPFPLHAKDAQWQVPEGHVFVLGDNRDYSNDSRFTGYVPAGNVIGRVDAVLWSRDNARGVMRWARILSLVR